MALALDVALNKTVVSDASKLKPGDQVTYRIDAGNIGQGKAPDLKAEGIEGLLEFETTARHEATTPLIVFKTQGNIGLHAHTGTRGAMLTHHDLASHDIRLSIMQVTREPALYEKLVKSHG